MTFSELIRNTRKTKKISQNQLAKDAGVSLATVQNIEAGRANPEIKTLESLLAILGFKLEAVPQSLDWDLLSHLGVPLTARQSLSWRPTPQDLRSTLQRLAPALDELSRDSRDARALTAFLSALKDHYPSIWVTIGDDVKSWLEKQLTGFTALKLRRLAVARLSEYL
jgi:transcriptional regulator with XRE-family HTH domain